jgi:energy-coupling factor transporter ATP-binding protein EcfA2
MEHVHLKWIHPTGTRGILLVALLLLLGGCGANFQKQEREKQGRAADRVRESEKELHTTKKKYEKSVEEAKAIDDALEAEVEGYKEQLARNRIFFQATGSAISTENRPIHHSDYLSSSIQSANAGGEGQIADSSIAHLTNPQEILERKLNNPDQVLTPNQSISLLNHCTQLGTQRAAHAADKDAHVVLGNTGVGKSTTLNALLGCQMKAEADEFGDQRIVVDPDSNVREVMPIGHGGQSRTFMPQIAQDPDKPDNAYCDCPGFSDNRGAEINIANAINTRSVLQQARGVKAVFLTSYNGLFDDRGNSIRAMESMCQQLFGSADNLRRYHNAVLLGITKAPHYNTSGQPLSINSIRLRLNRSNSDIATILANRIFLFDPLDRAGDNPDFWSLADCRNEIDQLDSIPQREATNLFQTVLTDSDRTHLLNTIRQLRPKITNAITQGEVAALGQHWQLLQRLRVIQHPAIEQLIQGEVLPAINVALQQLGDLETWTDENEFDQAEAHIARLRQLIQQLPGAALDVDPDALNQRLAHYRAQHAEQQQNEEKLNRLREQKRRLDALNNPEQNAPASHDQSNESP